MENFWNVLQINDTILRWRPVCPPLITPNNRTRSDVTEDQWDYRIPGAVSNEQAIMIGVMRKELSDELRTIVLLHTPPYPLLIHMPSISNVMLGLFFQI